MLIEENTITKQLDYDHYKDQVKAMKFRLKLKNYTKSYIDTHTYFSSRKIAKQFMYDRNYKGLDSDKTYRRLSHRFGHILSLMLRNGLISKYNSKQYKRVKEVSHLIYIDGKFRNPKFMKS